MNTKTLKHLNTLLENSRPAKIADYSSCYSMEAVPENLYPAIAEALKSEHQNTVKQRIINSAKTKTQGYTPNNSFPSERITSVSHDLVTNALPKIQAILDSHNKATLEAYETYRLACEQGVAVPPQD